MTMPPEVVVVGVDGSHSAEGAVWWATTEAIRRHAAVHLVMVNDDPARRDYAEKTLLDIADRCRRQEPALEVTEELIEGHPIETLIQRTADAGLLVLGSRGHGRFTRALLGSVSSAVAVHSAGPVVVVRGELSVATGPVVVGLDGSASSRVAMEFAVREAALRETKLIAVQAWHEEGLFPAPMAAFDREQAQQQVDRALAEQVAGWSDQYPDVTIHRVARHGHPVAMLLDAAREAQLLAVGHRGRGGFTGLQLGSVAAGVLHHARCPVAVLPQAQ